MKIFFAHSKAMDDATIDEWQKSLTQMFRDADYSDVEVVPGRDDFKQYAPSAGGFAGWVRDVATRKNAMTQKPYFDCFVSPTRVVGKATADILTLALHHRMTVIYAEKSEETGVVEMRRVTQVVVDDADDYTSGWWLDT